jgi:hypothetical protein
MKKLLAIAFMLFATNAMAQSSRQIQSGDVTGALGYTPLRSLGGMTGPALLCGTGISCVGSTISNAITPGGANGQIQFNNLGAFGGFTVSGDATLVASTGVFTLANINANIGSFGSATQCASFTTNAKGQITAASATNCTPAVASLTGLGTGVATSLAIAVGSAGAPVVNGGTLGTPSSGVATNLTGTASGLTAGTVTTNANLTGAVTSVGNAASLGSFTSANLRGALTDETGTGFAYFQGGDIGTPSAGVGTNLTALNASNLSSGTLPAARTNGHMNGTATNDNAAAGEVGEYVTASQLSSQSLTTGNGLTLTSISLTAGDWDVTGFMQFSSAGTTTVSDFAVSLSTTTNTLDLSLDRFAQMSWNASVIPGTVGLTTGTSRFSLSSTTTVYVVGRAIFGTSTATATGMIRARRAR